MKTKENKESVEAEVIDETSEPKKENFFQKAWSKTKNAVNGAVLESKIEMRFNEDNLRFSLYEKDSMLSDGFSGLYKEDGIVVFGTKEVKANSVIVEDESEQAYYVVDSNATEVEVVVNGVSYTRPATFIKLDKNVEEVKVIKAGKKYYLYKGN